MCLLVSAQQSTGLQVKDVNMFRMLGKYAFTSFESDGREIGKVGILVSGSLEFMTSLQQIFDFH